MFNIVSNSFFHSTVFTGKFEGKVVGINMKHEAKKTSETRTSADLKTCPPSSLSQGVTLALQKMLSVTLSNQTRSKNNKIRSLDSHSVTTTNKANCKSKIYINITLFVVDSHHPFCVHKSHKAFTKRGPCCANQKRCKTQHPDPKKRLQGVWRNGIGDMLCDVSSLWGYIKKTTTQILLMEENPALISWGW